jgi:hypothetical protein
MLHINGPRLQYEGWSLDSNGLAQFCNGGVSCERNRKQEGRIHAGKRLLRL